MLRRSLRCADQTRGETERPAGHGGIRDAQMGDSRGAMGRKGGGEEEVWEPLEFGGNWRGLENFRYTRTGASSTWARLFESGERGGVLYMLCNVDGGVDVSFFSFLLEIYISNVPSYGGSTGFFPGKYDTSDGI